MLSALLGMDANWHQLLTLVFDFRNGLGLQFCYLLKPFESVTLFWSRRTPLHGCRCVGFNNSCYVLPTLGSRYEAFSFSLYKAFAARVLAVENAPIDALFLCRILHSESMGTDG